MRVHATGIRVLDRMNACFAPSRSLEGRAYGFDLTAAPRTGCGCQTGKTGVEGKGALIRLATHRLCESGREGMRGLANHITQD